MRRGLSLVFFTLLLLAITLAGLAVTAMQWLPMVAGVWLPSQTQLALAGRFHWQGGRLEVPNIRYLVNQCEAASATGVTLSRKPGRWDVQIKALTINDVCLYQISHAQREDSSGAVTLRQLQSQIPALNLSIETLNIASWPQWSGQVGLSLNAQQQHLIYRSPRLHLDAYLTDRQLELRQLMVYIAEEQQPLNLSGTINLAHQINELPDNGTLQGKVTLNKIPEPLNMSVEWEKNCGLITLLSAKQKILTLPWRVSSQQIAVEQAQWLWPWASQPFSGGASFTLSDWQNGPKAAILQGRVNLLTQGKGGKGNMVLSIGPGKPGMDAAKFPFRLTGESKLADLQFYSSLPGTLSGLLFDPEIEFSPGSLLRMRGLLLPTLKVDEARWPLARVKISSQGIHGRLQAILRAHDPGFGRFSMHLDGRATHFWINKGRWNWRYWGNGYMEPLKAKWDVKGRGRWQDNALTITELSTGLNQFRYAGAIVQSPRLILSEPLFWRRNQQKDEFGGKLELRTAKTLFPSGAFLPESLFELTLKGIDPTNFRFKGQLQARKIGPVQIKGRWDGERLRGQAWWPEQPLSVFKPLFNPELKMKIRSGTLRAQMAFSAADRQGLLAGGHWVVKQGSLHMPDNKIEGVDFSLPFRYQDQRWQLGTHRPITLRIRQIKNQVAISNIAADLQGYYPWDEQHPLTLSKVSIGILDGKVTMDKLHMPQREAALLKLDNISLSQLITAIKAKQIAISGRIDGELPLWLAQTDKIIHHGWVRNRGPVTLRLDKEMADDMVKKSMVNQALLNWLRYMEISRSHAAINMDTRGDMLIEARVTGVSRFDQRQQNINLNYTQQENVFQLWRSLRFGDNLHTSIEQRSLKKDEN